MQARPGLREHELAKIVEDAYLGEGGVNGIHYMFTTAMRQSLLNAFVGIFIFYLPPVWLGVSPAVVMFMLAVDLAYQRTDGFDTA